jgi:hypothetical protein
MHGLKIFVDESLSETEGGFQVFYSRRSDGPVYRWSYAHLPMQWRVARVHASNFPPKHLCLSRWKCVPAQLQKTIIEHYQE